jgi:ABC-type branched-subunit amino acid transport system permease subunit
VDPRSGGGFVAAALAGLLIQLLILRHMQGEELRQTMVTIGLSIVIADVLLWIFTGQVHQMEAPAWLQGPIRDIPLIRAYSAYRLSLLGFGIAIGLGLWWLLNRTRVGMMIRAGVDDRGMLAASGVNVNRVFAITFMLGAGLAGFGGVIGAVELSMVPGEDTRLLLASLIVVIVGGMGSVVGAAIGAAILGLAETYGLAYAPTYSVVFVFVVLVGVLAFRPRGILGRPHDAPSPATRSETPHERRAMASRDEQRRDRGDPGAAGIERADGREARNCGARRRPHRRQLAGAGAACVAPHHIVVLVLLLVFPFVATPFLTFQVAAQSLVLGLIALSLTFLGGYGGMISLAQMTVAGIAGYAVAVLGHSSAAEISLGWPWWAALPAAIVVCVLSAALIGWLSVRTEGIYTIMITLAIGVAFYYLVLQNYSVFNGFQGLREVYPPKVLGIAWRDPVPFYFLSLACSLAGYLLVRWIVRAPFGIARAGHPRQPTPHERARLPGRRAPRRRLRARRPDRGGRRHPVRLVQRPDHPRFGEHVLAHQHPGDRRARRHEASDRRVHRRARVRAAADVCHRRDRPRALQPRDRHRLSRHRAVFPRRPARTVGEAPLSLRFKTDLDFQQKETEVKMTKRIWARSWVGAAAATALLGSAWAQQGTAGQDRPAGDPGGAVRGRRRGRHARGRTRREAARRRRRRAQDRDHQGVV